MIPTKQVILIRADLEMPPGKLAAQVAHASMGAVLQRMDLVHKRGDRDWYPIVDSDATTTLAQWLSGSFTKVCLSVKNEFQLKKYHELAKEQGIITSLITDEGRTVFNEPTTTCCAIGPYWNDDIDNITGKLRLY